MKKMNRWFGILLSFLMVALLIPAAVQAATLTTVTVKKTDTDGHPLAGAVFTLTGTGNFVDQNYNAESDENGIAEFVDVADGTYDLAEAMAPKGYAVSDEICRILVKDGIVYRVAAVESDTTGAEYIPYEMVTFVNEELPKYSVTVKKTDADGNPLAGAVFTLTGTGNFIGQNYEATSDANGNAVFQAWEGFYELAERTAPEEYVKSDKTYEIAIWDGEVYLAAESEDAAVGTEYAPYEAVTYVNEKLPTYPVTVKKTDAAGNPLAGAVFTLTGTGNFIGQNYEATSDKNGTVIFDVREGFFTLAEKEAPEGYVKSDKTYGIAVWGGKVHFVSETDTGAEYSDYEIVTYVNERVSVPHDPENPQTGDNGLAGLWLALLLVSGGVVIGTNVYGKKRKAV